MASIISQGLGLAFRLGRHALSYRRAREDVEDTEAGSGLLAVFDQIRSKLQAITGAPVAVLVDGLDTVLAAQQAHSLFMRAPFLTQAQAPIVIVGPITLLPNPLANSLRTRAKILIQSTLPLYRLAASADLRSELVPDDVTERKLAEVYRSRIASVWSGDPDQLCEPTNVRTFARASSGVVRTFIRAFSEAALKAKTHRHSRIEAGDLAAAIQDERTLLQAAVMRPEHIELLRETLTTRLLPKGELAESLLYEGYILHHRDGQSWYRPHELLIPTIQQLASRPPSS